MRVVSKQFHFSNELAKHFTFVFVVELKNYDLCVSSHQVDMNAQPPKREK